MLRPYQQDALKASRDKFKRGVTRQLITLPTGTGKTVVFANLPTSHGITKKVMVFVERDELAKQNADKIAKWNPTLKVGVEMGRKESHPDDDIIVASIPTLGRDGSERIKKFNPADFEAFVVDEAHHSVADGYKRVFEYFNLMAPDSKQLLLGVTATPKRGDGQALGQVYDEIVYDMDIQDAIVQGWLVPPKGYSFRSDIDLSGVKTTAGDFNLGQLEAAVNTPVRNALIVEEWKRKASTRQTIVFCVDIQHAKDLAQVFVAAGIKAAPIWGKDPHREEKLEMHRAGKLQVLTNCGVLTEGYDDPDISCVVMARPTKSQLLYIQMVGRGLRLPHGCDNLAQAIRLGHVLAKNDCLVLDAVDNSGRHSLVTLGTIFGLPPKINLKGQSVIEAKKAFDVALKEAGVPAEKLATLEDIDKLGELVAEVDMFSVKFSPEVLEHSTLCWKTMWDGSYLLLLPSGESCTIQQNLLEQWEVKLSVDGNQMEETFSTVKVAMHWADEKIAMFGRDFLHLLRRDAKWTGKPATPSQLSLLRKFYGSRVPVNLTKGEASNLITDFIARKRKKL